MITLHDIVFMTFVCKKEKQNKVYMIIVEEEVKRFPRAERDLQLCAK